MPSPSGRSNLSKKLVLSLGLIAALGPLAIDMYLPSMLEMSSDLGTNYASMQLSLTVFLLMMGIGQLLFGPITDAYGRRKPLLMGLILYSVAAAGAGFAQSFEVLIVARILQGLGAAVLLVVVLSSTRDVAEGVKAAQMFAMLMTIEGLAPIIAPAVGGFIGAHMGWRAVLFVLALFGILALLNAIINIPETLPHDQRTKLQPAIIIRTYGQILSDFDFVLPGLALTSVFFFLFAYIGGASFVYQSGFGMSVSEFGLVFGATGVAVLLGAMTAGRLVTKIKIQMLAVIGVALLGIGAAISLVCLLADLGIIGIAIGMAVAMFGIGVAEATLMSIAMSARDTAIGASVAVLGTFQLGVAGLSTPIAGSLAERGPMHWLVFLGICALITLALTLLSAIKSARSGKTIAMQH